MNQTRKLSKLNFDAHNDGGNVSAGSFTAAWHEGSVTMTSSSQEQGDAVYTLYFDGTAA